MSASRAPDGTLETLVPDQVWSVGHTIRMIPGVYLPARMTLLRLKGGGLVMHSPVPASEATLSAIDALGPVRVIITPNNFHHLYLPKSIARYPDAEVWGAPGLPEKRKDIAFSNLLGPQAAPHWAAELTPFFLAGAPKADETIFLHRASGTLVVTDSYFNLLDGAPGWLSPILFRMFGSWKKGCQSKLWRSTVKDKPAMAASTRAVLAEPFDRLVMAHGVVIQSGGHAAYREGAAWLGI
jgi:hypothetical protein